MIPKIIHYCWFGRGAMNDVVKKCVLSWEKHCPDYQIIQWNEDNFDISQNVFVKEAYEHKKWAFVSDYVRLYALYHHGGIYLDSDVELLKNLDDLLNLGDAVTGYQEGYSIPAAVMMAVPENEWIKLLLSYYDNRHFCKEDGSLDMTTNSDIITVQTVKMCGFRFGDSYIKLGNVRLLDSVYFAPDKKIKRISQQETDEFLVDPEKTYAIHYGTGSWLQRTNGVKAKLYLLRLARMILTVPVYMRIKVKIKCKKLGI